MRALEAPPSYHAATTVDDSPAVLAVENETTAAADGAQALGEPQRQAAIPQVTTSAVTETPRSITAEEVVDFNGNFNRSDRTAEDLEVIPLQDL